MSTLDGVTLSARLEIRSRDEAERELWADVRTGSPRTVATYCAGRALADLRSEGAWFGPALTITEQNVRPDGDAGELARECARLAKPLETALRTIVLSDAGGPDRPHPDVTLQLVIDAIDHLGDVTDRQSARALALRRFGRNAEAPHVSDSLRASGMLEAREGIEDGLFLLDAVLLTAIRAFAPKSDVEEIGALMRARVESDLFKLWEPGVHPAKWAILFAKCVWIAVVEPRLARERHKPPALVRAVHRSALEFHSALPKYDSLNRSLTIGGRSLATADVAGALFDAELIERGLQMLRSVAAHRLFRWEVLTGHEQALRGNASPHVLNVEGGYSSLAERIGIDPRKSASVANIRAILHAQAGFRFSFPDGSSGNLLILNERPAQGQQRARVRIELGSVLLPSYVHQLPRGSSERRLVPLLREPIPLYGRPNEHGEQLTMSLALLAELRERAEELAEYGSVHFTHDDWVRLADRSGVKRGILLPVIEKWIAGDGARAAPFLKRIEASRVSLGDVHATELQFLIEGGRAERDGRAKGAVSATRKRAKVRNR